MEESVESSLEERILTEFFDPHFASRTIADLDYQPTIEIFKVVMPPHPRISDIVAKFGPANVVTGEDISRFGVTQNVRIYEFGRLGLATPGGHDGVFWVRLNGRNARFPDR